MPKLPTVSRKLGATLLACASGVVLSALVLVSGPEPLEVSPSDALPQVSIGPLERRVTHRVVTGFGSLVPRQTLALTAQVPGEVTWVSERMNAGMQVEEGETLLRIDERDYAIAVAGARARLAQAQANMDLEQGRSEIAALEWQNFQATSTDDAEEEASPLALRDPQRADARAQLAITRAQLDQARLALERTEVTAPWPAAVVQASAVTGQVIAAGELAATLLPLDFAFVDIQVPTSVVLFLEAGSDGVDLRPVNDPDAPAVSGTLDGVIRTLSDDTRLATVRIRVERPLDNAGWLFGTHIQARIATREVREVVLVPAELIVAGNLVWIHRDGRAYRQQVEPIGIDGGTVTVVDRFQRGDALILERPIGLFDGAAVRTGRDSAS